MRGLVPAVHPVQHRIVLVHDAHRSLGDRLQILIGNDDRHLDDAVGIGLESGHFQVNPDEATCVLCHNFA